MPKTSRNPIYREAFIFLWVISVLVVIFIISQVIYSNNPETAVNLTVIGFLTVISLYCIYLFGKVVLWFFTRIRSKAVIKRKVFFLISPLLSALAIAVLGRGKSIVIDTFVGKYHYLARISYYKLSFAFILTFYSAYIILKLAKIITGKIGKYPYS